MDTSLDDLLNENEPEAVIDAVEEPQSEPQTEGPARDENGRFAAKTGVEPQETAEPVPPTEPQQGLPKDVYEPLKAVRSENKALKDQLDALTQQIQSLQAPKEQPAPAPSIWEDEQGWQQHFGSQVAQQASFNAHLNMSEMLARRDHSDFDAMKASFLQMAEQNPAIVQQALGDADPWGRAYQIAKNASTMQELGATNLDDLKAKLREELMAEMQAQAPVARPGLPPTLSNERNVGQRTGPAWTGPAPLDQLLR